MPDAASPSTAPSGTGSDDVAGRRLTEHPGGADADEALRFFDRRPAVPVAAMIGRWRGVGLPTGSALDGLLEAYGWYGKEFLDAETVHPLLFADRSGRPRPVDPALLPAAVLRNRPSSARNPLARAAFAGLRPLLTTTKPRARLRTVEHRGVATAAMVYDALPIIDVFRRIAADTVLGLMDLRGLGEPFLFVLRRE